MVNAAAPKDAPAGQVCDHDALHALPGVDQSERDLVAAAHHAMAHALLFHHLLEFTRIGVARPDDARLAVTRQSTHLRQSSQVATKDDAAALEEVGLANGRSGHAGYDVLVGEEGSGANRVLSVTAVGRLVDGRGKAVGHAWIAPSKSLGGHQQHARAFTGRVGRGGKSCWPVTKHHNVPDFHFDASDKRATEGRAIRHALGPTLLLLRPEGRRCVSEATIR